MEEAIRFSCDFCTNGDPAVCYTTAKLATYFGNLPLGFGFDERWSACIDCAEIIDRRDLNALVARVVNAIMPGLPDEFREMLAAEVTPLYAALFANLSSSRRICLEEAEREPRMPFVGEPDADTIIVKERDGGAS